MLNLWPLWGLSVILAMPAGEQPVLPPNQMSCEEFKVVYDFIQDQHIRFHVDQNLDRNKLILDAKASIPETLRDLGYHFLASNFTSYELPRISQEGDPHKICSTLSSSLYRAVFLKSYARALDPYTDFYLNEELDTRSSVVDGDFVGVGIGTDRALDHLVITEVVEGGPSYGKLMVGDKVFKVDHHDIRGLSEGEVRSRIRGSLGSKVTFQVQRAEVTIDVEVIRGRVQQKSVSSNWSAENVLMVKVHRFYRQTPRDVEMAIQSAGSKLKGLILDLRDNPGGLLQAARDLVDVFISSGVVVYLKGKEFEDQIWALNEGGRTQVPMVVLVNEGTASAAEIVAGALQDYGRALIVGRRTYGKGSVQNVYETQPALGINYRGGFKLTTMFYYLPSGRNVRKLEPDIVSAESNEDKVNHPEMPYHGSDRIDVIRMTQQNGDMIQRAKAKIQEIPQPTSVSSEQLGRELVLKLMANSADRSR
jgi:carboxyl-terminal processing protease